MVDALLSGAMHKFFPAASAKRVSDTHLRGMQPNKPHAHVSPPLPEKLRLELVELLNSLASSGKNTENIESDLWDSV